MASSSSSSTPAFIFDLDGTLLDSVYQHVTAWQRAFAAVGVDLSIWRIHKRIGMSGSLLAKRVSRESGTTLTPAQEKKVEELHTEYFKESVDWVQPLPGSRELLTALTDAGVPWIIATSGAKDEAESHLAKLQLPEDPRWISSADVSAAKPDPEIFVAAADRLGVGPEHCIAVGDAIWDLLAANRARMLAVGLMCGGYSREELMGAHAFRVFLDPADLHGSLDEIGVDLG
ncbi:MAG: HAD family hydrolase [Actinomycetota bacterium]|nr:HAD family hydrolase [Actinomycetota bacterium]